MIRLIRSELLKVRSTQVWFWLLLASLAITAASVIGNLATAGSQVHLRSQIHDIITAANSGYIAAFVLGVLSVTTEFRYQTITPTVLATPSR